MRWEVDFVSVDSCKFSDAEVFRLTLSALAVRFASLPVGRGMTQQNSGRGVISARSVILLDHDHSEDLRNLVNSCSL